MSSVTPLKRKPLERTNVANELSTAAGGLAGGKAGAQIFVMGLDALGGYVFARMAHNMGSSLKTVLITDRTGTNIGNSQQATISAHTTSLLPPELSTAPLRAFSTPSSVVWPVLPQHVAPTGTMRRQISLGRQLAMTPIGIETLCICGNWVYISDDGIWGCDVYMIVHQGCICCLYDCYWGIYGYVLSCLVLKSG